MPPRSPRSCVGGSTRCFCRGRCCLSSDCREMAPVSCLEKLCGRWRPSTFGLPPEGRSLMGITVTVLVPPQHPAFDGHFPGAPLLPGVVLLDEMLRVVEDQRPQGGAPLTAGEAGGGGAPHAFLAPPSPGRAPAP